MKTTDLIGWGAVSLLILIIIDKISPGSIIPEGSRLYWLLHPEEHHLQQQITTLTAEKERYWSAYIDSVTTGIDRVNALRSALDPIIPAFAPLEYPFINFSFAQTTDPSFPGLPTPAEWSNLLQIKLRQAIQQDALSVSEPWNNPGSWPSVGE